MATIESTHEPEQQDSELVEGWPEFGELHGKRVRLTQAFVDSLRGQNAFDLVVELDGHPVRPLRFCGGAEDFGFGEQT
jgi:hypothetical protein